MPPFWIKFIPLLALTGLCAAAPGAPTDLELRVSMPPLPASVGRVLTWQISVSNRGPALASSVILSNTLPAGVLFSGASSSQGSIALGNGAVVGELGALSVGSNASVTVQFRPELSGNLTNPVSVFAAEADLNSSDNSTNVVLNVLPPFIYIQPEKQGVIPEGNSGTTNANFIVRLDAASGDTISIDCVTLSGGRNNATPGQDFVPTNQTLVFPPGVTNQIVSVAVLGDALDELDETFSVVLTNATNVRIAQGGITTATIGDDDPQPLAFIGDASVLEGDIGTTALAFPITLSAPSGRLTHVTCRTFNGTALAGSDYDLSILSATFPAGVVTQFVAVAVRGNTVYEGDETFTMRIIELSGLSYGNTNATGLVIDDDAVPGRLDHFAWGVIASPQLNGIGFQVTVTALDAFSNAVTGFSGAAALTARNAQNNSLPVSPSVLSNFVAGVWQGTVAVSQINPAVVLRVDDGLEHLGQSGPFVVVPVPQLILQLPAEAMEGDLPLPGLVSVITQAPRTEDLLVAIAVSDGSQATANATVTIPGGATNATFDLTPVDDALLDGSQPVVVSLSASNCVPTNATVVIHDNETTTLSLMLPASIMENAGTFTGVLHSAQPPGRDVTVSLTVGNGFRLQAPASIVLPAGASDAPFIVTVLDDGMIMGNSITTFRARVQNWTPAQAEITLLEDESTNLVLTLPVTAVEGQGTLNNAGRVQIGGTLPVPLQVNLASTDTSELTVPPWVIISAGATSVTFNVTLPEDNLHDGTQAAAVIAQAFGFASATNVMRIADNDPASIRIDPIPSPQTSGVPFQIRVRVLDTNGLPASGYTGIATLRAWGTTLAQIAPHAAGPFVNGEWTGLVAITNIQEEVRISAEQGAGVSDISNPFFLRAAQIQVLNVPLVRDLVYSPQLGKAYVSSHGSHAFIPNISILDVETGALQFWKNTHFYCDKLALSRDGTFICARFPADGGYGRFITAGGFDLVCSFGSSWIQPVTIQWQTEDFELLGATDRLVATRYLSSPAPFGGWMSEHHGIAVFPPGNALPDAFDPMSSGLSVTFGPPPPFGMNLTASEDGLSAFCTWPGGYAQLAVHSNGVTPVKVLGDVLVPAFSNGYTGDLVFDQNLLYRDTGDVLDPARIEVVGRLPANGLVRPDSALNRIFLLAQAGPSGWQLQSYDHATLAPLGTANIAGLSGTPGRPTRCGTNTVAFVTSGGQIMLVHGLLLPNDAATDLASSLRVVTPTVAFSNVTVFSLSVTNRGSNAAANVLISARLPAALGNITITASPGNGSASNGTVSCFLPLLAPGASAVVSWEVSTLAVGRFACVASVASDAREADYGNNVSRLTLAVPVMGDTTPRVTRFVAGGSAVRLNFPTMGGERYRVECSTNLAAPSWATVMDYIYGTGRHIEVNIPRPPDAPGAFYRLVNLP